MLAVSAAATVWLFTHAKSGTTARIVVDGKVVQTIDVSRADEYLIETGYGFNRVRTKDGHIWVEDADCPDKLCVRMGRRSDDLVPIACLPHHLVIQIDGGSENDVDAIAGVAP